MSFAESVRGHAAKAKANLEQVHKKVALEIFSRVILRTPVDTGRLRGNWQAGVGVFVPGTVDATDTSGSATIAAVTAVVTGAPPHASLTLTNNLPYARRIEYDSWSRQAPAGMARVSVAEFDGVVAGVVAEVVR